MINHQAIKIIYACISHEKRKLKVAVILVQHVRKLDLHHSQDRNKKQCNLAIVH